MSALVVYPQSAVVHESGSYALTQEPTSGRKALLVRALDGGQALLSEFEGVLEPDGRTLLCALTPRNARALRARLPWLNPRPLGLQLSAGFGDRLGLATPGHARAARMGAVGAIFAQQSVRENARTGRTPQQVMDDATWGVFQEGYHGPWGADADHLKTPADAELFFDAGFTFFTVDPGEHVRAVQGLDLEALETGYEALPWDWIDSTPEQMRHHYLARALPVGETDEATFLRAAVKYGQALAATTMMYRHLERLSQGKTFDFELSVDETDDATSPFEHYFLARELERLEVRLTSLALRFSGRFEKGVDFIGDLKGFTVEIQRHAEVQRHFGGYKLSLHSGSDKFSIYPALARAAGERVHLKTAGTSYLEALRVVAAVEPVLFRKIYALACERYPVERASYHVSADPARLAAEASLADAALAGLIDQFDARQALHVTFGAALTQFGAEIRSTLLSHEEMYADGLERHFRKHLEPFLNGR